MARSKIGRSQVAHGKKGTTSNKTGRAAQARAAARKPQRGSGSNPVQRMGLGSIYDKITVDNTGMGAPTRATGGSGGGGGYARRGGGGGGYSGPSAADLAAAEAARIAAYRQQILNQYVAPTDRLYSEATKAAASDAVRSNGAFDAARNDIMRYGRQVNVQADRDQEQRRLQYGKALRAMGLNDETALRNSASVNAKETPRSITGTSDVVNRNQAFVDTQRNSMNQMYVTQRKNGAGRVKAYQDELERQRQLQRKQIASTYGIQL